MADAATEPKTTEKPPKLVKMKRDPETYPAPHTAEIHPDEVKNFVPGGWIPV